MLKLLKKKKKIVKGKSNADGNDGEYTGKQRRINLEGLLSDFRNSFLIGKEIMVYTTDGYHYGVFQGSDEDFIYLTDYVFEYSARAGFSRGLVTSANCKLKVYHPVNLFLTSFLYPIPSFSSYAYPSPLLYLFGGKYFRIGFLARQFDLGEKFVRR
jgi:hypothetical protein